jgi:hypothetical protein
VTSRRLLVTKGVASARRPRNDRKPQRFIQGGSAAGRWSTRNDRNPHGRSRRA